MSIPTKLTGDDWICSVTLKRNGVAQDVSLATDISAAVVSSDDQNVTEIIGATTQSSGTAGADWANGVVVVKFPAASTSVTEYGQRYIEIQVTIGGDKESWPRQAFLVKKGIIA